MKYRTLLGACFVLCMALLTACGGSASSTNASPTPSAREVRVTLTDSTIESSRTTFSADIPYHFVVTNKGQKSHDFIIRTRAQRPPPASRTDQGILYLLPSTQLPAGATRDFTFSFPLASVQSQVQFASELPTLNGGGISIPVEVKQGASAFISSDQAEHML